MRTKIFKNMIFHKYQQSKRRQICSESIDTFSRICLIQYDYLCFNIFKKWLSENTKIPHDVKHSLKTLGDTNFCVWGGIPTKNNKKDRLRWVQIWRIHQIYISFLIDMKFISKLFLVYLTNRHHFFNPHLRLFKISKFHSFKIS